MVVNKVFQTLFITTASDPSLKADALKIEIVLCHLHVMHFSGLY